MATLAETEERLAGDTGELSVVWHDLEFHILEDAIQLRPGRGIRHGGPPVTIEASCRLTADRQTAAAFSMQRENAAASGSSRRMATMADVSTAITPQSVLIVQIVFGERAAASPERAGAFRCDRQDRLDPRLDLLGRPLAPAHATLDELGTGRFQRALNFIESARCDLLRPPGASSRRTVTTETLARRASSSCSIRSKARAARIWSGVISMIDSYHRRVSRLQAAIGTTCPPGT